MPILDENAVKEIENIIYNIYLKRDSEANKFNNKFNRPDKSGEGEEIPFESLRNEYYNEDYIYKRFEELDRFKIGESGNNLYNIYEIPNFNIANHFAFLMPGLCYLRRNDKFLAYSTYKIFIFAKKGLLDINPIEHNVTVNDDYGTSSIGVAIQTDGEVSIEGRYGWTNHGSDSDFNFIEFKKITGSDIHDLVEDEELKMKLREKPKAKTRASRKKSSKI